jgi:hypothetical protein
MRALLLLLAIAALSGRAEGQDSPTAAMSGWQQANGWSEVGGVQMHPSAPEKLITTPGTGILVAHGKAAYMLSKENFSDLEAHVEFLVPKDSNSGLYFCGSHEIQIYDSYGKEPSYAGNACGGIYPGLVNKARVDGSNPKVNASLPPGEWQTLDVIYRAPRYDAAGKKIANAVFEKVVLNGKTVQENVEVPQKTICGMRERPTGTLRIQGDHGPVACRNIRLRPLNK